MRKIEFVATLYVDDFTTDTDEDLVRGALLYGSKHQDFSLICEAINSAEDYEEEDD